MRKIVSAYPQYKLSRNHPFGYDAAWMLAIGLNNSLRYLGDAKLEDFAYNNSGIHSSIIKGMDEVDFLGVSVR